MKRFMMFAILIGMMGFYATAQTQEVKGKQNTHKSNDISFDDILFWVGEGSHEAMFIVNWCSPDIAFAWGYRFNDDSITVSDMMQDIADADSRIYIIDGGGFVSEITYNDSTYHLALTGDYWMYNVNEGFAGGISTQYIYDMDMVEFGDESCGISDTNWIYTWNIPITPVSIPKVNDISFDDILFWVGHGSHQAMFIVNWCSPEIAFAWGYRFNDDSITVSAMMQDIAAADSRIHFTDGGGYITEITYNDSTYNLALTGDYWMYNVNEGFAGGISTQYIYDMDKVEFGDESCGASDTNWIYTWNMPVTPVSVPKVNDISFDDILFWVGHGSHQAMFIVNWCSPEIAFAWGYRFNDDSITVSAMMQDIAAADSRIHFTDGGGYVTEITYNDSTYNLALTGDYWMYNVNEGFANGINDQYIYNTDRVEFGDNSCGISDTNWIYTWNIPVTPVSVPDTDVLVQTLTENNIHIQVYPNPCSEMVTIHLSGVNEMISISLTDISGRIVYKENVSVSGSEKRVIAVNKLQRGMYFIRFQGTNLNKASKLIVY